MNLITISEIFGPTLQGEGALAGRMTVFVRTGGCDYRCRLCDSLHAVLPENKSQWRKLLAEDVLSEVAALSGDKPVLVTLSGGNPALQPLEGLIELGRERGYTFAMETQGSKPRAWFNQLDHLILSPKPPSFDMPFDLDSLRASINHARTIEIGRVPTQISVKVVVVTEEDYLFARAVREQVPEEIPFFITPGNHTPPTFLVKANNRTADGSKYLIGSHEEFDQEGVLARTRWLVERCAYDNFYNVSIIPQLHTLLWGNRQGV